MTHSDPFYSCTADWRHEISKSSDLCGVLRWKFIRFRYWDILMRYHFEWNFFFCSKAEKREGDMRVKYRNDFSCRSFLWWSFCRWFKSRQSEAHGSH